MLNKQDYTRIFLWRHPETKGAVDGVVYGHSDVNLSRPGEKQMKAMARRMEDEHLAAVYCSDLTRCKLAADLIGRSQQPRRPPIPLVALRELNLGLWEGLTYKYISRTYPDELKARNADLAGYRIKNGESLHDLAERIMPVFQEIVERYQGRNVAVVAHGGVNRVFLCKVLGAPLERVFRLEQDFACFNIIDIFPDGIPVIRVMNQAPPPE